jgi:hypothetical protein
MSDIKSTANIALEDLARELPRLQEEAKALWGEAYLDARCEIWNSNGGWEHNFQQMVIAENPIQYLGEHI